MSEARTIPGALERVGLTVTEILDGLGAVYGGGGELETSYAESVRRHNARVRAENCAAWASYHRGQAEALRRTLASLVARHEEEAERLAEGGAA